MPDAWLLCLLAFGIAFCAALGWHLGIMFSIWLRVTIMAAWVAWRG